MDLSTVFFIINAAALLLGGGPTFPWPHLSAGQPAAIVCAEGHVLAMPSQQCVFILPDEQAEPAADRG
jgi:hypothetical protein